MGQPKFVFVTAYVLLNIEHQTSNVELKTNIENSLISINVLKSNLVIRNLHFYEVFVLMQNFFMYIDPDPGQQNHFDPDPHP